MDSNPLYKVLNFDIVESPDSPIFYVVDNNATRDKDTKLWTVTTKTNNEFKCRLLIIADGMIFR